MCVRWGTGCWAASERKSQGCTDMDSPRHPHKVWPSSLGTVAVVPQGNSPKKGQSAWRRKERGTKEKEGSTPASEGMGRGAPDTRADIAQQTLQNSMAMQAVPLQPMENPHTGAGRQVLNEASTHGETTQEQVLCSLGQGSTLEQFLKDCTLRGTHNGAEKKWKELLWTQILS